MVCRNKRLFDMAADPVCLAKFTILGYFLLKLRAEFNLQ